MKKALKYCFLFFILLGGQLSVQAQLAESDLKAAYIERFTRFVEWSDVDQDSIFFITVLGHNTLNESLDRLFGESKINNKHVVVSYSDDYKLIAKADLVFVCKSEKNKLPEIIAYFETSPVLIISDSKGFAKAGAHINMYLDDAYIRFEINKDALEKSGLKISSLLLATAKIVTSND